jgi:TetR/AcrR family transcriptional regulator
VDHRLLAASLPLLLLFVLYERRVSTRGKQFFDELTGETAKKRGERIRAPVDGFPEYLVRYFVETNRKKPEWIEFLTREAFDTSGDFISSKEEREALLRGFVDDIKDQQAKGLVDKSLDPEQLTLMVLALSFYPRIFKAATKTLTGLSPTDPEFERRWSDFLNELGHKFEEPKD